jgi:hypothetical protein
MQFKGLECDPFRDTKPETDEANWLCPLIWGHPVEGQRLVAHVQWNMSKASALELIWGARLVLLTTYVGNMKTEKIPFFHLSASRIIPQGLLWCDGRGRHVNRIILWTVGRKSAGCAISALNLNRLSPFPSSCLSTINSLLCRICVSQTQVAHNKMVNVFRQTYLISI